MGPISFVHGAQMLDRLTRELPAAAVRSAVILAAAGAVVWIMRRASAAARYWVWVLGFAGALLLPVLSAALPSWRILPNPYASQLEPTPPEARPVAAASVSPADQARHVPPAWIASGRTRSESAVQGAAGAPTTATASGSYASGGAQPVERRSLRRFHLSWRAWLTLAWSAGSLVILGRTLLGYLSLGSLRRRCVRIDEGELHDLLVRLRGQLRIRRPVELLSSPLRMMPMTWGVFSPRLLVPPQAADWPVEQRRAVLLHELGHVKRWDCLSQLLVQLVTAMYWFNPMVWIANSRTQIERERACDDLVLNFGAEASSYAGHLLRSVSTLPILRLAAPAVAMARPSMLEGRLRAILDGDRNRRALRPGGRVVTVLVLLAGLIPVAMTQAQQSANSDRRTDAASGTSPATRPVTAPGGTRAGSRLGMRDLGVATPKPGTGPTCSLDATLYDIRMPADRIGRLDVETLERAAGNAASFEEALAALGSVKPLYRLDQSVRLSGENLMIGTQTPVTTGSYVAANGHTVSNFSYQSTGVLFSVAGTAGKTGPIDLDLRIQLSSIADSGVTVGKSNQAPVFRNVTILHKGPVQPHKPFVVISVDANAPDASGKAVAYIGRITVGEPQTDPQAVEGR